MGNCNKSDTNNERIIASSKTKTSAELNFGRHGLISSSEISFSEDGSCLRAFPNIPKANKNVLVVDSSSESGSTWPTCNSTSENRCGALPGIALASNITAESIFEHKGLAMQLTSSSRIISSDRSSVESANTKESVGDDWSYPMMETLTTSANKSRYHFFGDQSQARERRACFLTESEINEHKPLSVSHSTIEESKESSSRNDSKNLFLRDGLMNCTLFNGFHPDEMSIDAINDIIEKMYPRDLSEGQILVRQGEAGDEFFLVQYGELEVWVSSQTNFSTKADESSRTVAIIKPGMTVGEAALMYSTKRTATLCATQPTRVWVIEASLFHRIRNLVKDLTKARFAAHQKFLSTLPIFAKLKPHELHNLTQACREVSFKTGQSFGDNADSDFYAILEGSALMMWDRKSSITLSRGEEIHEGNFFMRNMPQNTAIWKVTASSDLKCLKISVNDFNLLVKPYINMEYDGRSDASESETDDDFVSEVELPKDFDNLVPYTLNDLVPIAVAGTGNFGQVVLVKVHGYESEKKVYALKVIEKNRVINTGQIENVQNERRIMFMMDSAFIIKLYATYHDETCVYFLLEKALGGELFSLLRRKTVFSESQARFYLGCVILALEHIHSHMILYRDLKPENILITETGYLKVTDFGFSKRRNQSTSLCGTPEYMAPELITGGIQSFAVDWWGAGVLLYEMLVGEVPFRDSEQLKMYEDILESSPKLPDTVSLEGHELTHELLEKNSFRRLGSGPLGAGDIKKNNWFQSIFPEDQEQFIWEQLSECKLTAPYLPTLTSIEDSRYFSPAEPQKEMTELSTQFDPSLNTWCEEF